MQGRGETGVRQPSSAHGTIDGPMSIRRQVRSHNSATAPCGSGLVREDHGVWLEAEAVLAGACSGDPLFHRLFERMTRMKHHEQSALLRI